MSAFATIAAVTGVLAAGIIYGTDVFCALVQRPALARLDDATMAAAMGRVHQYGDRRLPAPGVIGILAAAAATAAAAVGGSPASATAAGIALIATLIWLGLYLRVAAPINQALTAAAIAHVTPGNARALQSRWDSIITARALLMAAAVAGLAVSAAAHLTLATGRELKTRFLAVAPHLQRQPPRPGPGPRVLRPVAAEHHAPHHQHHPKMYAAVRDAPRLR